MKTILQRYLLEKGEVVLPGIGQLQRKYVPAKYDLPEAAFVPPHEEIVFIPGNPGFPSQDLLGELARQMDQSEEEAFEKLQQYALGMQSELDMGKRIDWSPMGTFSSEHGHFSFGKENQNEHFVFPAIAATRLSKTRVHEITVGDSETTTEKMQEWLNREEAKPDRWWVWPLVVSVAAVALIVWKFVR